MKKLLTMLAAAAISCFCLTAKAWDIDDGSYKIGDYVWFYYGDSSETNAVITGVKYNSDEVDEPFLDIPKFVVHNGQELKVTGIEEKAFLGRRSIVGAFIPATVEWIGYGAFAGCSSLETLEFEEPVVLEGDEEDEYDSSFASGLEIYESAFEGCDALEFVEFPAHLACIEQCAFRGCDSLEEVVFDSGDGVLEGGVSIGSYAFEGCTSLYSVEFWDWEEYEEYDEGADDAIVDSWAVVEIGDGVFKNCHALEDLYLGVGVRGIGESAFERDVSLESVEFPWTLEYIGNYAFCDCATLEDVDMEECGEGTLEWEVNAFDGTPWGGNMGIRYLVDDGILIGCKGLLPAPFDPVDLVIPDEVYGIADEAFKGCDGIASVTVPVTVEYIADEAFMGCPDLTSVVVAGDGSDIGLSIGYRAFAECENLESVVFEDRPWEEFNAGTPDAHYGLTGGTYDMSGEAFYNCQNLTDVEFGVGLSVVGESAFQYCISLESVSFPWSLSEIESLAFGDCVSLEDVSYDDNQVEVPDIAEDAFLGTPYDESIGVRLVIDDNCVVGVAGIVPGSDEPFDIEIPEGIEVIDDWAFFGIENLASVTIPASVRYIGESAFEGCTGLEYVEFEEGDPIDDGDGDYYYEPCLEIGYGAFAGCTALTSIYFPPQTTYVGESAFERCSALEEVFFESDDLVSGGELVIEEYAFGACGSLESVSFDDRPFFTECDEENDECSRWCNFTIMIGEAAFRDCPALSDIYLGTGVCYIGDSAFASNPSLESVEFPWTLETIGSFAFGDCENLADVWFEGDEENIDIAEDAFEGSPYGGRTRLVIEDNWVVGIEGDVLDSDEPFDIEIPEGIEVIGDWAFFGIENLASVTIPASVRYIGESAFDGCSGLEYVEFEEGDPIDDGDGDYYYEPCLEIGYGAFAGCTALTSIYFPPQTTYVGESAFEWCWALEEVFFESDDLVSGGELVIEEYAFCACGSLESVSFDDRPFFTECDEENDECSRWCNFTIMIGEAAFRDCPALSDIYLGTGVCYIGDSAFASNPSLESVEFPWTLETIGGFAFGDCENLADVWFEGDEENIDIAEDAFEGSPYGGRTRLVIEDNWVVGIEGDVLDSDEPFDIEIPEGIEVIGDEAFFGIENLASVTIPASVCYIGESAFEGCSGLEYVEFEEGDPIDDGDGDYYYEPCLEIGYGAFAGCTALTSIYFPPQTTYVGESAFEWCSALEEVFFESDDLVSGGELVIDEYAFCACESLESVSFDDRPFFTECDEENHECSRWCDFTITIGEGAFAECSSLSDIYLGTGVNEIGDSAFASNPSLESVEFPWTLETIGGFAFGDCENLADVWFEGDAESIDIAEDAFEGTQYALCAYRLDIDDEGVLWSCEMKFWADDVYVEIPDGVVAIEGGAFWSICEISGVSIPLSVEYIGMEAFANCEYLEEVDFEGDIEDVCIDAGAFWNTPFNDAHDFTITVYDGVVTGFLGCDVPDEIVIPDGVTEIGLSAFDYDYYMYDEVMNEHDEIFEYSLVEGIEAIYIPESVKQIDKYAFYNCWNATSVEIANPYVMVEGWAFYGCRSLEELTFVNPGMTIVSMTLTGYAECDDEPWDEESDYADEYFHLEPGESITVEPDFSLLFDGPEGKEFDNIWVTFNWGIVAKAGFDPTGSGETTDVELVLGKPYGNALDSFQPEVTRHGQVFVGWLVNGKPLTPETIVGENDIITPAWSELEYNPLYPDEKEEADTAAASLYDGYVLDADGSCIGSVQVKVGKENATTHIAVVSATAQLLGQKKLTGFKAKDGGKVNFAESTLTTTITLVKPGQADIVLRIGKESLNGEWGDYSIAGCRNTSKKSAADYAPWVGVYNVDFATASATGDGAAFANGFSFVSVSVAAKGKVKVSGVMADGIKMTGTGQLLIGEGANEACVGILAPMYTGKTGGVSFVLWISKDGNVRVESVSDWKNTGKTAFTAKLKVVSAAKLASPAASLKFHLDAALLPDKIAEMDVLDDYLPLNVAAPFAGGKFAVAKANKLKVNRADGNVVVTGDTDNDAGLKLTYTAKSGAFKGSFTIYTKSGSKLKKVKAVVTGGIVGNVGFGTAVVKGVGSFPVTLSLD